MICGVNIGGKDTLEEWGLMLCNDLSIGAAVPRYRFIEIPEMSGALDLTEALTGSVPYDQRQITFTLFAVHDVIAGTRSPATEEHFQTVLARFSGFANGKRLHVYLPDNPDHYFVGRVSVGGKSGYNSGRVKVEVLADPYRIKDGETTLTVDDDDFFKTATPGALVTFDDGGDDLPMKSCVVSLVPEQSLNGYDSPWPAGGGKNKVGLAHSPARAQVSSGVSINAQTDDTLTLTSNANATYACVRLFYALSAGTYTIKYNATSSDSYTPTVSVYNATTNALIAGWVNISPNTVRTVTLSDDTTIDIRFFATLNTAAARTVTFTEFQLESGSSATAYAPYSNICPISGHTGATLYRTGKNLASISMESYNATQIISNLFALKKGTYTISFDYEGTPTYGVYLREGRQVASSIKTAYNVNNITFTLNTDYDNLCLSVYYANGIAPTELSNIMVELGSTATAYEPYQGDTYSVTFTDQGTVYGGTYDFVSGKLTVTRKTITLDGSQTIYASQHNRFYVVISDAVTVNASNQTTYQGVISENLPGTTWARLANYDGCSPVWGSGVAFKSEQYTSISDWTTYFTNNPTTFSYELATPLEYDLTPQEVTSLLGENNVWSNDGDISELVYMFTDEIIINNEGMPAIPTINASEAGPTVTLRGASHVLASGDNRFSDFILQSGENVMQVEDPAGTLTIKYQEGML